MQENYMSRFILLFLLGTLSWCAAEGRVDIAELESQPRKYVGSVITVGGEVTKVSRIPLSRFMLQSLYDGTGTLPVLTTVERLVGATLEIEVGIIGIDTENAEVSSGPLVEDLTRFFEKEGWMTPEEANRAAVRISNVLKTIFRGLDFTLMGVEQEKVDTEGYSV